ncbi:MAG: S8 family peptidase [Bacteroidetes bacterium]|nr:S8 family peptidase [Bacteroidota bacterium]
MRRTFTLLAICSLILISGRAFCQQIPLSAQSKLELQALAVKARNDYDTSHQKALALARKYNWTISRKTKGGGIMVLEGVDKNGFPHYLVTHENIISAATTNTNALQPGGILGLNLSGSSLFLDNKLAIWDGGSVYSGHQEFAGKTIKLNDPSSPVIDHATHVSGTMIAKGVYPAAKGMAFNAATLQSYDFNNDDAEMSTAAPNLLLSNHSYGDEAGWVFDSIFNRWEWFGLPGDTVDYTFGFYDLRAQTWDKIAFNTPYYLIVESAGNARGSTGPAVGQDYFGYKSATNPTMVDKGPRPANISSNDAYQTISTTGNANNIMTVGAIDPLPFGPTNVQSVSTTYFSSWGPTNDGRVKPDIVANGLNVLSCGAGGPANYVMFSGTSQAAPNVTGSLYLLQEYYAEKHAGAFMRAATLKGLACATAFDGGNPGPDYIYGWGLLNTAKAAQALTDNGTKSIVRENTLAQGQTQTFNVIASGNGPLMATICWTDPAGDTTKTGVINDRTPKLVNDLDVRISDGTITYLPWVLDPAKPSAPATKGDNIVDNVEQVYLAGAIPGRAYTITVSHKGTLKSGSQDYSLITTGIGGVAYCASGPASSADSRINNVTLSNINNTPPAGCTTYSDYTNMTVQLEQSKTYPLSITLGTCGANFSKIAKVFIDWNGDGVFDAGELVATTGVINGTGTYTTNITVPNNIIPGNFSLMRVVCEETTDPTIVTPCGSYAKGETQDYRVQFLQASVDVGAIAIVSPVTGGVCSGNSAVTVKLKNFGSGNVSNIPVKVTIIGPGGTVTTLNQTFTGTLTPSAEDNFTFTSAFNVTPASTYVITAATTLASDPIPGNNQVTDTVVTSNPTAATNLTATYCNTISKYQLSGAGDGELLWYSAAADSVPVAYGAAATTAQAPVNNTYYAGLNDFKATIGPRTKNVFTAGGYNQFSPAINVFTRIPVIISTARLYIGYPGQITFNVADSTGEIVSTTTINAVATRSNPQPGAQPDDPNDKGQVYNLNLLLPSAGSYTINTVYDSVATIFRNNGGVTGYPFKIGDVFSIVSNTATSSTDTAYYKNPYYHLSDIHLISPGRASVPRQAVTLTKPVITQNGTVLSSNFASGNQWYLEGVPINGATGQTYTPLQSGNYTVGVTAASGCESLSDKFVYVVLAKTPGNDEIGLTLFPVPANGQLNVVFASPAAADMSISMVNSAGQTSTLQQQSIPQGNYSAVLDTSHLPPGGYILKVLLGSKNYTRKVIIER